MRKIIEKAEVLLEALPYIQRFRHSIFVVKYGGSFMDSPNPKVRAGVASDIVFLEAVGINAVVVHGGGKAISKAMIRELGGKARGYTGKEIFRCRKLKSDEGNLGYVGEVVEMDVDRVRRCVYGHVTPIISPIGVGQDGESYNINADVAAAKLAVACGARRLVFLSDVPGLMRDPNNPETLISSLKTSEAIKLKEQGVIEQGMIPKVDSGVEAVQAGVHRVHFVDGRVPHSILLEIFTDKGIGTEIVH
jgi:acetylglutamate kinase